MFAVDPEKVERSRDVQWFVGVALMQKTNFNLTLNAQ